MYSWLQGVRNDVQTEDTDVKIPGKYVLVNEAMKLLREGESHNNRRVPWAGDERIFPSWMCYETKETEEFPRELAIKMEQDTYRESFEVKEMVHNVIFLT